MRLRVWLWVGAAHVGPMRTTLHALACPPPAHTKHANTQVGPQAAASAYVALLEACWAQEISKRPSFEQVRGG